MGPAGKDGSMEDFADQVRSTLASPPSTLRRRASHPGALIVLRALKKPTSARFPLTDPLPHRGSDERRHGRPPRTMNTKRSVAAG